MGSAFPLLHRVPSAVRRAAAESGPQATSEAFDDVQTPPQTPVLAPSDGAEALRRRLQEAVSAASERGAGQVTLDVGLVQSLLSVFDQQMSEYASLKQNLDGMKVRLARARARGPKCG